MMANQMNVENEEEQEEVSCSEDEMEEFPLFDPSRHVVYLRINTLKVTVEKVINLLIQEGWRLLAECTRYRKYLRNLASMKQSSNHFMVDFHIPHLLIFPPFAFFNNHPGVVSKYLIMQDKGSCMSSFLLDPEPQSIMLDVNAGPGLNSQHFATLVNNEGIVYATDMPPFTDDRRLILTTMFEESRVTCHRLCDKSIFDLTIPEAVDYIVVDPTSSFGGMILNQRFDNEDEKAEHCRQVVMSILRYSFRNFPTLKKLVYTARSFFPIEGERIVDDILKEVGDYYTLVNLKELLNNEWMNVEEKNIEANGIVEKHACASKCLRVLPEHDRCESRFIAIFEKKRVHPFMSNYTKNQNNNVKTVNPTAETVRESDIFDQMDEFQVENEKPQRKRPISESSTDTPEESKVKKVKEGDIFENVEEIKITSPENKENAMDVTDQYQNVQTNKETQEVDMPEKMDEL